MITEGTARNRVGGLLYYAIMILLGYLLFLIFQPFLVPLGWAAVIVVVTYPAFEWLAKRTRPSATALILTFAVTAVLIVPMVVVMLAFIKQGMREAQVFQKRLGSGDYGPLQHVWTRFQTRFPEANLGDLDDSIHNYIGDAISYLAGRFGTILKHTATFFFDTGLAIFAMFYLYRDGESMVRRLREVLPFESKHRDRMLHSVHDLIYASVTSTLAAALAHAILGGLAFYVTGVNSPLFWGVLMGFFSFIPVFGTVLVWAPLALGLIFGGHLTAGIILIILCSIVIGSVDNILRPLLIAGRAQMGGLVILIAVLGGITVFGLLGVVLGPVVVAVVAGVLDVYAPSEEDDMIKAKPRGRRAKAVLE